MLCAVRCALCAVRCALCAVRCALCAVRCALEVMDIEIPLLSIKTFCGRPPDKTSPGFDPMPSMRRDVSSPSERKATKVFIRLSRIFGGPILYQLSYWPEAVPNFGRIIWV